MGYAAPGQRGTGIHTRLRARTFIFVSSSDPNQRFAFVSVDGGMGSGITNLICNEIMIYTKLNYS